MEVINKKITTLKPAEYNPRQITKSQYEHLKKSIEAFEIVEPAVINTYKGRENIIVGGHQRIKVAKDLGHQTFPCVEVKLPLEREKELNVRLNKNTGDFDFDLLANHFEVDDLIDWGFEDNELGFFNVEEIGEVEGEDDVPEAPQDPVTKLGDIWLLGDHRVMCGDSTMIDNVDKLMNGKKADMVFTDPPYNIDYDFSNNGMVQTGQRTARFGKIKNDKMTEDDFDKFVSDVFTNLFSTLKDGGSYYITAGRESTLSFNAMLKQQDLHIQSWLIWVKENFNISRLDYHPKHEVITYGWKKGKSHSWYGDRAQTDVLNISREKAGEAVHPTQKPVALIEYLLNNSSKKGDTVLDLFLGSGSTLIACEKTKRKCYGMELDPKYVDVVIKRWQDFTGKEAVHEQSGETYTRLSSDSTRGVCKSNEPKQASR